LENLSIVSLGIGEP